MTERSPFDPPLEELLASGTRAVEMAARHLDERYRAPSADYTDLEPLLQRLSAPPPATGGELPDLLGLVEEAAGKGFDTAGPGFLAYIPGGGLWSAALGDFVACVLNRYTGVAQPAPALVQLEATVLRWLCEACGLPPGSQGVLTPGGSMANLSAIVAARTRVLGEQFLDGTLYVSSETHHSLAKSARFAGLPVDAVRVVPTDGTLRMDLAALARMLAEDAARGRRPFLVVGSAGTYNTGVVDPLEGLVDLAAEYGAWCHVDAAYGGFFVLTERGRTALAGIERADSVTLDPHKGMFLPYGTGCLLARDGASLRAAHELHAQYLPSASRDDALPDFSSYSPELTRDFRGLRMWLPLHLHGTDAFVEALDEKLDLARALHADLAALPGLEVPWEPQLSLFAFRPRGGSREDALRLLDRVNASGRVWLSATDIEGQTYLRMCVLSHRSTPERMHEAAAIVAAAVEGSG